WRSPSAAGRRAIASAITARSGVGRSGSKRCRRCSTCWSSRSNKRKRPSCAGQETREMADLTLYTNPQSRGRIVRWMLEEVGADYDTEIVRYDEMKSDRYLAINPMGKVPAIKHGGHVITEGAAICAYLADVFPQAALGPPADEKADYYRWLFYAAGPVEAAVSNQAMGWTPTPERERMFGYGNFGRVVAVLDELF